METGEYRNGEKHGEWITYYANGQKRSEGRYEEGVKEGLWIQYWPNGIKKSKGHFVKGKFTGQYTAYHDNGNLEVQGRYNDYAGKPTDGTKDGPWNYYNQDGKTIWRIITYKRGSRTKPDEHPNPKDGEEESTL